MSGDIDNLLPGLEGWRVGGLEGWGMGDGGWGISEDIFVCT